MHTKRTVIEKATGRVVLAFRGSPEIVKRQTVQSLGYSPEKYEIRRASSSKLTQAMANALNFPISISPIELPPNQKHIIISADIKGIGDAKSRLAAIQSLRKRRPDIEKLGYLGPRGIVSIFQNHPSIDYVLCSSTDMPNSDDAFVADLSEAAGRWESARGEKLIESREEIYTRMLGLRWHGEKPVLHLTEDEMRGGFDFVGSNSHESLAETRKIGIFLRSAEIWKDWQYVIEFARMAKESGYEIFLFDPSLEIDGYRNVAGKSIREVMSILPYMDCVVSPDTAGHHLCEALDVPCIALFGSMRTDRYLNRGYECSVEYLQGNCKYRKQPSCMYTVCEGKGHYQPCMDSFKPEFVLKKVEEKIKYGTLVKNRNIFSHAV